MKTTALFIPTFFATLLLTVYSFAQPQTDRALSSQRQFLDSANEKQFISLNGTSDYAESTPLLGGLEKATLMGWVRLGENFNTNGFLFGQDVLQLKAIATTAGAKIIASTPTQTVTLSENLAPGHWYHISLVFDAASDNKIKLYLNGRLDAPATVTGVTNNGLGNSSARFAMGKNPTAATGFFNGALDEIRVFNSALTESAIQKMVYQEIKPNGTAIRGEVIPKDIESVNWNNLIAYYRMDDFKDKITGNPMSLQLSENQTDNQLQSAPMPFVTQQSGTLAQALGQNPGTLPAWSIIQIKHNVSLNSNTIALGMIVEPNTTVSLSNDIKLQNTWYLKLDGKIDLKGKSQLVQTLDSELDPASSGFIEREQQGQSSLFNYNYWCAPVGSINDTANNNSFTVNGILRDATNPDQLQNINWTTALNGAPTSPVTLSGFWIFKFQNQASGYANWTSVGPNGTLLPGQGFTLKGCGSGQPTQNLAFVGKPNNGTITSPIAPGNLNLTGNPYPSALDAEAFIKANSSVINGTIYFWEHFATNTSHQLADYQGGYATKNLVGGTPPVAPAAISDLGESNRMPHRFIPVGQGFFVQANAIGGNIVFTNSQRAFVKENASGSNVIFRPSNPVTDQESDNQNDAYEEDTFARIRLGFNADNFHRQVLLGFMNEHASSAFEPGYDAHNIDTQPSDMYLMNLNYKLVIEGEGYFDEDKIYPIGVKTGSVNPIQFVLDGTENFDENQPIYIYDNVTLQYHDMRAGSFTLSLPAGTYLNRFSLRFKTDSALGNTTFSNSGGQLAVVFTHADDTIVIQNDKTNVTVQSAVLLNMLGQSVAQWNINPTNQHKIQIPVGNISSGAYVVKVLTTDGDLTKKIVIQ